nr:amidohydrolase [uncultured Sulfurimonas sp.]
MSKSTTTIVIYMCIFMLIPLSITAQKNPDAYKREAVAWLESNEAQFDDAAGKINEYAETAFKEHKSAKLLADMLEKQGFAVERGVADIPTAFVATYGSGYPVVGILAEYDALPGLSQKPGGTTKDPIEQGKPGHGCGHNLFGTGSTAAAIAAKNVMAEHNLKGTIKLFGCPAEETLAGKIYMAKAGVFDDLDICFTWHPSAENKAKLAKTIAMNNFEVIFRGKTAHGAGDPWNGRSALDAVELMNTGVNYMREHVKPTVRIHYSIPHGGEAPNIVPDYAKVWYFVRDVDRPGVDHVYNWVLKCAEGAALMTETEMEVNLLTGCYEYLPNHALTKLLDKNLRFVGPPKFTEEDQEYAKEMQRNLGVPEKGLLNDIPEYSDKETTGGGSTDVADVSWLVPISGELGITTTPAGVPWHSWAVSSSSGCSAGFKGMHTAAQTLATSAIEAFMNTKIVEEAKTEFRESTKDFTYTCAVPLNQKPPLPED